MRAAAGEGVVGERWDSVVSHISEARSGALVMVAGFAPSEAWIVASEGRRVLASCGISFKDSWGGWR